MGAFRYLPARSGRVLDALSLKSLLSSSWGGRSCGGRSHGRLLGGLLLFRHLDGSVESGKLDRNRKERTNAHTEKSEQKRSQRARSTGLPLEAPWMQVHKIRARYCSLYGASTSSTFSADATSSLCLSVIGRLSSGQLVHFVVARINSANKFSGIIYLNNHLQLQSWWSP